MKYKDIRISFPEFGQRKAAGELKFDVITNVYLSDGTYLGQTQSIMRWIATAQKGKKGE